MGVSLRYCDGCGGKLVSEQLESDEVLKIKDKVFCPTCKPKVIQQIKAHRAQQSAAAGGGKPAPRVASARRWERSPHGDRHAQLRRRFGFRRDRLSVAGGLWIAWPRQASGVATDLSGDRVRAAGLAAGLVDNKVCAIDDVWSGLRVRASPSGSLARIIHEQLGESRGRRCFDGERASVGRMPAPRASAAGRRRSETPISLRRTAQGCLRHPFGTSASTLAPNPSRRHPVAQRGSCRTS